MSIINGFKLITDEVIDFIFYYVIRSCLHLMRIYLIQRNVDVPNTKYRIVRDVKRVNIYSQLMLVPMSEQKDGIKSSCYCNI